MDCDGIGGRPSPVTGARSQDREDPRPRLRFLGWRQSFRILGPVRDARSDPQTRQHGDHPASRNERQRKEDPSDDGSSHSGNHRNGWPLNSVDEPQFLTDKSASLEVPKTAESKCQY